VSWTLPCDVPRAGLANGRSNISLSLKLLCLERRIGNLAAIREKSGYLLVQRGKERFVGNPESYLSQPPADSREASISQHWVERVLSSILNGVDTRVAISISNLALAFA